MYAQYLEEKQKYPQALLLFRLGDFYELFGEDAETASRILELTLTSREIGKGRRLPMCGVPYHAVDSYVSRLVDAGWPVAICDQMEDPRFAKGLVKREVTRVVTPGTRLDPAGLDERRANRLVVVATAASAAPQAFAGPLGLAALDLSTGEFTGVELSTSPAQPELRASLWEELLRLDPAELLFDPLLAGDPFWEKLRDRLPHARLAAGESRSFIVESARQRLLAQFGTHSLAPFGLEGRPALISAAGAAIAYVQETQKSSLPHITSLRTYSTADHLLIDPSSQRNLELTRNLADGSREGTLLAVLDRTVTSMGARLLRQWVEEPLVVVEAIRRRLDAVSYLVQETTTRRRLRQLLSSVRDIQRLTARVSCGNAGARELVALASSLEPLPALPSLFDTKELPALLQQTLSQVDPLEPLARRLRAAFVDEPPINVREGGLIREGFSPELDEVRALARGGEEWIARLEAEERERTGIKSLKVGFNKVFGYYIEVTRANLEQVPDDYIRKQTLAGAERYITPALKEKEAQVLGAQERLASLEYDLFVRLREETAKEAPRLLQTARAVAQLDVLATLAEVAVERGYCQPEVTEDDIIEIHQGRHPVVEARLPAGRFVPNDVMLDSHRQQIIVLTGPNMAGKSTYLRQTALIVLMAQMGSFVPATAAHIGVVDRIFTRVGASDNLVTGESTFMVEMNELSYILHHATPKSLVILDEVGRGTSTFDGLSLAWAVTEYLHNEPSVAAKTLFATHYHELTQLAHDLPRVVNFHVAVERASGGIIFLRRVEPGGADESYGIEVARLAGLPEPVLRRAHEVLQQLEQESNQEGREGELLRPERTHRPTAAGGSTKGRARWAALPLATDGAPPAQQLLLFAPAPPTHPILQALADLDLNHLTPLTALNLLAQWQEQIRKEKHSS
ncbi:MAG: DNA mismatch repair protein MutS [Limnochordaceae bacterium]|nr:DNA mismatch repair protein MutS [Limnochordaceae bacterium]